MKDFISIKRLALKCVSGVDGWSRKIKQPVFINIGISPHNRLKRMGLSDDIRHTLNYDAISTKVESSMSNKTFDNMLIATKECTKIVKSQISFGEHAFITLEQPKQLLQGTHSIHLNTSSDSISESLKNFNIRTIIGINELERVRLQTVCLNITLKHNEDQPLFNYEIVNKIDLHANSLKMLTIESFVSEIANFIKHLLPMATVCCSASKPNALNSADQATVQVCQTREINYKNKFNVVYIAFGTNQGNTIDNIQNSIAELRKVGIDVIKTSNIFESNPKYFTNQPQFLNGVFKCHTLLDPKQLLAKLKHIEYDVFNRVKLINNGPRTLDLDIILFNNEIVDLPDLKVPHIDMLNRSFVLRPLNELLLNEFKFPMRSDFEEVVVPTYKNKLLKFDPYTSKTGAMVMGILNVTTDSFSDGGELNTIDKLLNKAEVHISNGATILDIGAHSTRPQAKFINPVEEANVIEKSIKAIRSKFPNVLISVDTFNSEVASKALQCGANLVNDAFGGRLDDRMLPLIAQTGAPIILTHSRGDFQTMSSMTSYPLGVIDGVAYELRQLIDQAFKLGVKSYQIILDPGIGFAKTPHQDIELLAGIDKLRLSKHFEGVPRMPMLIGASRKSFIQNFSSETDPKQRLAGTLAAITMARMGGGDIFRVHDTREAVQALAVVDATHTNTNERTRTE